MQTREREGESERDGGGGGAAWVYIVYTIAIVPRGNIQTLSSVV